MKFITVPAGRFAAEEDAAAAKRREIAERLKRGESVNVTPSGQIVEPNDSQAQLNRTLKAPEGKEFSFHEVIYWFLRQRTYSDIKSPSIKLPKEDEGDAVMYILEKLDDDLKFLTQLGVECQMSISPTGSLVLKENEPSAKTHPRFELSFGSQDNEILFSFNECCYKYHPGLFKDAYLEFLSKEGADH